MNTTQTLPELDAPGAGLPLGQRLLLKFFVGPVVSRRAKAAEVRSRYEHVTEKMLRAIEGVPVEALRTRVLVDPIPGIEDSSRFWSAEQVFEHLVIVSKSIESAILTLASGKALDYKVDIAKVKPPGHEGAIAEFTAYSPGLLARIDKQLSESGMSLDGPQTLYHPWFGPFSARQWYWLLGAHQSLHARQLKEILEELR
jgi:hypothetical protein